MIKESGFCDRHRADHDRDLPPVAEPDAILLRRLREAGVDAVHAVSAFAGHYPQFGGTGSCELLLTRERILALRNTGELQLWAAATGPRPTRLLQQWSSWELQRRPASSGGQYDPWQVGGKRLWIDRNLRRTVESWSHAAD